MDFILIKQIGVAFKIANLDISAQLILIRVLTEEKHSRIRQIITIRKTQLFHQDFFRFIQKSRIDSALVCRKLLEMLNDLVIHFLSPENRKR